MDNVINLDACIVKQKPMPDLASLEADASDLKDTPTYWVWENRIPEEEITIFFGDSTVGKTLTAIKIASVVTTGSTFPDGRETEKGRVLFGGGEDHWTGTLRPRLKAAGADLSLITFIEPEWFKHRTPEQTREYIKQCNVRLIVLDPLKHAVQVSNPNDDIKVRAGLLELSRHIKGTSAAIVGIMHPNKKSDLATAYRLSGSGAWFEFPRSVMMLAPNKTDEPGEARLQQPKWTRGYAAPQDVLVTRVTFPPPAEAINEKAPWLKKYTGLKGLRHHLGGGPDERSDRGRPGQGQGQEGEADRRRGSVRLDVPERQGRGERQAQEGGGPGCHAGGGMLRGACRQCI
jgi:AAA domain